jgi:hypothetical protein
MQDLIDAYAKKNKLCETETSVLSRIIHEYYERGIETDNLRAFTASIVNTYIRDGSLEDAGSVVDSVLYHFRSFNKANFSSIKLERILNGKK